MGVATETYQNYFANRRYVAFIDILGFSALVKRVHSERHLFEEILAILREVAAYRPEVVEGGPTDLWKNMLSATAFSDNIVLSSEARYSPALIAMASSILCLRLLGLGVFTRGGITCGSLYHDEHVVFGDALIEAYELERSVARYPRIVLDRTVASVLLNQPAPGVPDLRRIDFDGIAHLHYLSPGIKGFLPVLFPKGNAAAASASLAFDPDTVRKVVESALIKEADRGIRSKLIWFARYFNEYAESLGLNPVGLEAGIVA